MFRRQKRTMPSPEASRRVETARKRYVSSPRMPAGIGSTIRKSGNKPVRRPLRGGGSGFSARAAPPPTCDCRDKRGRKCDKISLHTNPTTLHVIHEKAPLSSRTAGPTRTHDRKYQMKEEADMLCPRCQARMVSLRRMAYFRASVKLVLSFGRRAVGSLSPVFSFTTIFD